jgi:ring-1,2-phenylacetyl-CoA epoxidase subunit PaaE
MNLTVEQLTKPLKIIKRIQETDDAVSLAFEIPADLKQLFHYQAGQFVTLFLDINGEMINRSYSLCTSPLTDSEFKITVKKVSGGKASTFLCDRAQVGQVLRVTPPAGSFFKPSLSATHYFLFAAGSGITPIFSIAKTVLSANPENLVTLGFCNRNETSIIYARELSDLREQFKGRFEIHHLLSKPTDSWQGARGRCTEHWLQKINTTQSPKFATEFYLCGPDGFMDVVRTSLMNLGVSKSLLRVESFAVGMQPKAHSQPPTLKEEWTYIGDKSLAEQTSGGRLSAMVSGELVECDVKPDQNILEALIEAGASPPYSCMDGACMACMAKVKSGLVYQTDAGILSEENIECGETLTCQARVLSRNVTISYDDI